jgi:hypothetical protein
LYILIYFNVDFNTLKQINCELVGLIKDCISKNLRTDYILCHSLQIPIFFFSIYKVNIKIKISFLICYLMSLRKFVIQREVNGLVTLQNGALIRTEQLKRV